MYKNLPNDHTAYFDFTKLPIETKAYWAGLLDGEGHLAIETGSKGSKYPVIALFMTCDKTVNLFQSTFNLMPVWERSRNKMKDHWKDCYGTKATTHKAAKICEALLPYFVTKSDISKEIALFYLRSCENCEEKYWGFSSATCCSKECTHERKLKYSREYNKEKYYQTTC